MASLKKLASIPSLTQLYRKGIVPTSNQPDASAGNESLNEKICTIQYDITKLQVDAIVNAANRSLQGGGGVDGAIHRAAGPGLLKECKTLRGCNTGSAKITDAYDLPCKKVIHAVGPVYDGREESEPMLRGCYKTALELAAQNGCKSIAFCAISTGIYGYPNEEAAEAALDEVKNFLEKSEDASKIDKVIFVNFLPIDIAVYKKLFPKFFPPVEEAAQVPEDKDPSEEASRQKDAVSKADPVETSAESPSSKLAATSLRENPEAEVVIDSANLHSKLLQVDKESASICAAGKEEGVESKPDDQTQDLVKSNGQNDSLKPSEFHLEEKSEEKSFPIPK